MRVGKRYILIALISAIVGAPSVQAQVAGPLDQVRERTMIPGDQLQQTGRYVGALDQMRGPSSALHQADLVPAAEIVHPVRPSLASAISESEPKLDSVLVRSRLVEPQIDELTEEIGSQDLPARPSFETAGESAQFERPQFEDSVPEFDSGNEVVVVSPPPAMNHFVNHPAHSEWSEAAHVGSEMRGELNPAQLQQPNFQQWHQDTVTADSFSIYQYTDGTAFGHNMNRLYHPLEGPTTNLLGGPTIASGFGACPCDDWKGFCDCCGIDYDCDCSCGFQSCFQRKGDCHKLGRTKCGCGKCK